MGGTFFIASDQRMLLSTALQDGGGRVLSRKWWIQLS